LKFYLGTHMVNFVEQVRIPWFVSITRILKRKSIIEGDWMLDSGGFTQISQHGDYTISEQDYLDVVEYQKPVLAFCQDWMCEPQMLKKTGLTVRDHQDKTLESYLSMASFSKKIRPVLQGWDAKDYVNHLRAYKRAGVDIHQLFGVGTVCSRNGDSEIIRKILSEIITEEPKLKLHGFGVKSESMAANQDLLWSADSMAWSVTGRMDKLCGMVCPTKNCANCLEFALLWRKKNLYLLAKE